MPGSNVLTAVQPGDCFEHWHQVTCRNYSVTDCRRVESRNFRARVSNREFGPLVLSDISSTTGADDRIKVTRTSAHIRKDYRDEFMLWLSLDGEAVFTQDGAVAQMQPGDLVLHDQAQPFTLEFGTHHSAILITIPRPLLVSRLPTARKLVARRIPNSGKLGTLAATVVRQLVALDKQIDDVAKRISSSTLDLLATTLEVEFADRSDESSVQMKRLLQVKRYISANLHVTGLDLDMIANAQNMSTRSLNRLFAREGTTPIRWLWQQRLAASFKALAEGQISQVTDAALSYGFSDSSHFSRAFKAAFGQSPQQLTRSANVHS